VPKDVIGTAYVRIAALSEDFEKQVAKSFDRLKPVAEKGGADASESFGKGWDPVNDRIREGHQKAMDDLTVSSREGGKDSGTAHAVGFNEGAAPEMASGRQKIADDMGSSWAKDGPQHGSGYSSGFNTAMEQDMRKGVGQAQNLWRGSNLMRFTSEDIDKLFNTIMPNSASRGAHQAGQNVEQELTKSFSNIGTGISKMFSDMFGGGSSGGAFKFLTDGADEASKAFTVLFSMGQLVGSALVTLVAGIANVVSGLFAMVAAAGQAVDALAVIPGMISAIAQAGIVLMVGFKGIGKAITEGLKLQPGMSGATQQAQQLATAQRGVATAARAVTSAEQAAVNAKKELANAQKGLNDAYKEGAKQLRDIQFASEDASLQEEQAAIDLANAKDNLAKTRATNPADSRVVQEAELQYKQADLSYREARARNKDASQASAEATKKGVKGSQAVVSAQDRLVKAQENVVASNQRVADAQVALADAQKRLAETQMGALGAAKLYNDALKKFGPEGQKFIKTLVGMQGQFRGFKQAAGEGVFKALNTQLGTMANGPFFPMIKKNFATTSTAIGGVVTELGNMFQEAGNMKSIDRIMQSNTKVIGSMGSGMSSLVQIFISMIDAARPLTEQFTKWAAGLLAGWSATMKADNASGALTAKFQKAADVAKLLGKIIANVAGAIFHTGQSASGAGKSILDATEKASRKWNDWTKSVAGKKSLKEYFDNVAKSFVPIMEGINAIVKELFKLGGNTKLTGGIGPVLKEIATWIAPVGEQVAAAMPALTALAHNIGLIFVALQKSDALNTFVGVLEKVSGGLAGLLGAGPVQGFLTMAGGIMGVTRALRFMLIPLSFFLKAIIGKDMKTMHAVFGGIGNLMKGKNPFKGLLDGSAEARKELAKQMKVDELKKKGLDNLGKAGKHAADGIEKTTGASKKSRGTKILDKLGLGKAPTGLHEKDMKPTGGHEAPSRTKKVTSKLGKIGKVGGLALGGVGLAVGALAAVAALNKDSAAALGDQITGMVANLPTALTAIAGQIPKLLGSISGAIGPLVASITSALPGILDAIVAALPVVLKAISDALPVVIDALVKLLPVVITAVANFLPVLIQTIVKLVPILINAIVTAFPVVINALVTALPIIINAVVTAVPMIITALVDALPVVIKAIVDALPLIITALIKAIPQIIGALIKAIPEIIGAVIKAIPQIIGAILGAVPQIIGAVISLFPDVFKDIFKAAWDNLVALWNGLVAFFTGIWNGIVAVFNVYWTIITTVIKVYWAVITAVWNGLVAFFTAIWNGVVAVFTVYFNIIKAIFTTAWNVLTTVWGALVGFFSTLWTNFVKGLSVIVGVIAKPFQDAWNTVTSVWGTVTKYFGDRVADIVAAFSGIKDKLGGAISGMWDGFKDGFKAAINWVIGKWNDLGFELKIPDGVPVIGGNTIGFDTPNIPPLAAGGVVGAVRGGVLARIAEAGRSEVVKPLDGKGMTASDRLITNMMQAQKLQMDKLVSSLTATGVKVAPAVVTATTHAAVTAAQRATSVGAAGGASNGQVAGAIDKLTASVDALQKPLVGGDFIVKAAPGERAEHSVPRALRNKAFTRTGAR